MSKIRSKNTKPELVLRKALFVRKFRYCVNVPNHPESPILFCRSKNGYFPAWLFLPSAQWM